MELSTPGTDGVAATRRITAEQPDVAVVALTTLADDRMILDCRSAPAAT